MHHTGSLSASSLMSDPVKNHADEKIGDVKDIMIDLERGQVSYVVLAVGGFLGMGEKLFAIPWSALEVDTADHSLRLDASKETFENLEGFDPDNWPDTADREWGRRVHEQFGQTPYWERQY